ncbi:MAG: hypothetical protein ACOC7J_01210 [Armatimonadota bacterium]
MRKRPEIPEDVFFDTAPAREAEEPEAETESEAAPPADDAENVESAPEVEETVEDDVLAKSMGEGGARTRVKLSEVRAERERKRAEQEAARADEDEESEEPAARVGRPPAQEGPKVAVTLYLTEPVAHLLEEVKFRLLTEYNVKTSKSAVADSGLRNGLDDLQAAADDLRRE